MTVITVSSSTGRLPDLAANVNREHRQVMLRGQELIDHAIRCGEALLAAKVQIPRGSWLLWLSENVELGLPAVHVYMRLAEHQDEVRVAGVESLSAGMRLLADKPRRGQGPARYSDEQRAEAMRLLDQHTAAEVAVMTGITDATLCTWKKAARKNQQQLAAAAVQAAEHRERPDRIAITDQMIERLASWMLHKWGKPGQVINDQTRELALEALQATLAHPRPPIVQALHNAAGVE